MYGARSLLQRYSDTLDAHARSDVVNGGKTRRKRKRKEASDQVDQGLIDFLIGSYMTSGESERKQARACRPRRSDHWHQPAVSPGQATWNCSGRTCSQMATRACSAAPTSWVIAGRAHNHNTEATTLTTHATHATSLLPARQHAAH